MRITVALAAEVGSMKAHFINTVKMAEGFAKLGHEITIICYRSSTSSDTPQQLSERYGLKEHLNWRTIPAIVPQTHHGYAHKAFATVALPVTLYTRPHLLFARNYILPSWASRMGIKTIAETHAHVGVKTQPLINLLKATHHHRFKGLITISPILKDYYVELGAASQKTIILPSGVNIEHFLPPDEPSTSPYSSDKPIVAYVGHLYDYKGIPTILESANLLPNFDFHLVGGFVDDVARQQAIVDSRSLSNVTLHGMKSQSELPPYLYHADVLLLPPSAKHPSAEWTSPVKLGEYLASGTPIVATKIPALEYWLTDEVYFVKPDSGQALAQGIQHLIDNNEYMLHHKYTRIERAKALSYKARAETILNHINLY